MPDSAHGKRRRASTRAAARLAIARPTSRCSPPFSRARRTFHQIRQQPETSGAHDCLVAPPSPARYVSTSTPNRCARLPCRRRQIEASASWHPNVGLRRHAILEASSPKLPRAFAAVSSSRSTAASTRCPPRPRGHLFALCPRQRRSTLLHVDHRQLPIAHRPLPTAPRADWQVPCSYARRPAPGHPASALEVGSMILAIGRVANPRNLAR